MWKNLSSVPLKILDPHFPTVPPKNSRSTLPWQCCYLLDLLRKFTNFSIQRNPLICPLCRDLYCNMEWMVVIIVQIFRKIIQLNAIIILKSTDKYHKICFFAEANVIYIPWDPSLVLHLPTSWWPACSRSLPHMHQQRWDLARPRMGNHPDRRRTRYHCASDPANFYIILTYCLDFYFIEDTVVMPTCL